MDDSQLQQAMVAFRRAVALCGSQAEFGRRTGIKQQTVSIRLAKNQPLKGDREVLAVEAATGVSRHDLRPDIYPLESSGTGPGVAPAVPPPPAAGVPIREGARS